ncbi:MAG: ABC transporter ATP-binding protein [Eubacteriales bacterium]|nr:ABC transporter ATP-binding protein [Eubacteriales bacterium]
MNTPKTLIEVKNYSKYFEIKIGFGKKQTLKALDNVNFTINEGETLSVVGESGCGKSTLGKTLLGLHTETTGSLYYKNELVDNNKRNYLRDKMQMIFQDPFSSLNPRMTIFDIIKEPIVVLKKYKNKNDLEKQVYDLMDLVGIRKEYASRYPHEFSGGQLQRVGIARALSINPEFIVCDEPVSALDVSIKAQIINLFMDIQEKKHITYLFITHDLLSARYVSTRIMIMYLGQIMEIGDANEIINNPLHPYSKVLLSSIYVPDIDEKTKTNRIKAIGEIPSPLNAPIGCPYFNRCPFAKDICKNEKPILKDVYFNNNLNRKVACHIC